MMEPDSTANVQRPRLLAALLAALTMAVLLPATPADASAGFGDVAPDRYYTVPVRWMVSEGITEGVEPGCYGPEAAVTRGQVAALLYRLDASVGHDDDDETPEGHPFRDVVAGYQQRPVSWLYHAGLTTGVTPQRYEPDATITRGDFAVLLWRYAGRPDGFGPFPFTDVTRDYQHDAVAWMADTGITTGTSATTFDPDGPVTRGQAAAFLFRFADPDTVPAAIESESCVREIRLALAAGGFTPTEAWCAAPYLVDFDVEYLLAVVEGRAQPTPNLYYAAAEVGENCLTFDRIADLSRLLT